MLQCGDERLHCGCVRFVFVHLIQNKQRSFTSRLPLKLCLHRAPCCKKKHQESNKYCRSLLHGSVQMTSFSLEFKYLQSTRSVPAPSDSSTASLKGVSEGLRVVAENQKIYFPHYRNVVDVTRQGCFLQTALSLHVGSRLHQPLYTNRGL